MPAITLEQIAVYPIKGCRALLPSEWPMTPLGLAHDREWMIVRERDGHFLSQRHHPQLARLIAIPNGASVTVSFDSATLEVRSEGEMRSVEIWDQRLDAFDCGELAARFFTDIVGEPARLVRLPGPTARVVDPDWAPPQTFTGFADMAPVLVTSLASIDLLRERSQNAVDLSRFRPNLVFSGLSAHGEDALQALRCGDVTLSMIKPCARCSVIEIDQRTGEPTGDGTLRTLANYRTQTNRRGTRGVMFGQNALPIVSSVTSVDVGSAWMPMPTG